jgi:hypothetical protein
MERISTLFGNFTRPTRPNRRTERGDLLDEFLSRLNPSRTAAGYRPISYGRLAYLLTAIKTADLYALRSKMIDGERRGVPASAIFWLEIRPNKTDE